ncbi:MAG: cobalamin-dependent protein [Desulfobacteraceae bacterium]|jgi:5-methyltetrahydrofolate--homocysteine methyltransferase
MQELINAMADMQEDKLIELTRQYLEEGKDATEILTAYQEAMAIVGQRFEEQTYFIPELIMAGEMMKSGAELIGPYLKEKDAGDGANGKKKFLLATIEGDIHDIGKDIVGMMMGLSGFEVLDLGVDVPIAKIIEEAKSFQPDIIGISGLLTLAFDPMKKLVDTLKEEGLRDNHKVIVGGAQIDDQVCSYIGADAYATDVVAGVNQCKEWVQG